MRIAGSVTVSATQLSVQNQPIEIRNRGRATVTVQILRHSCMLLAGIYIKHQLPD